MKILIIDDDPATTDLVKLLLEPTCSTILLANSGTEGVNLAKEYSPDLIILDIMMPDMSGCEVTKAVRRFSSVPVLVLSALDSPKMIAAALDAGADEYIIKPVVSRMLIAQINKLVRRSFPHPGLSALPI